MALPIINGRVPILVTLYALVQICNENVALALVTKTDTIKS
jgi:hypothetical protein